MIIVEIVGIILMVVGVALLVAHVAPGEGNVQIPGVTVKAPASVLILVVGVLVFLFPFSPWWPTQEPTPTATPTQAANVSTGPSPSQATPTPAESKPPPPTTPGSPVTPPPTTPPTEPNPVTIDFETPPLGSASRQLIDPYEASGVSFVADSSTGHVGLVANDATSACVEPRDTHQTLGTGPGADSIGLSGFPIRATFSSPLQPVADGAHVTVVLQSLAGTNFRVLLFDSGGAQVGAVAVTAGPPDGTCGNPGGSRARATADVQAPTDVKSVLIETDTGGRVFVIDSFSYLGVLR